MREILFRGKRVDNREWVEGSLVMVTDGESGNQYPCIVISSDNNTFTWNEVNPESVGEFIGLTDKNDKKIFEGDIGRYDDNEEMSMWVSGEMFIVICLKGRFSARMHPFKKHNGSNQNTMNDEMENCVEIIGNIHDNPELVK